MAAQPRSTVTSTAPETPDTPGSGSIGSPRTAAATAARQRQAAERAALRLGLEQLENLPDSHLLALLSVLLGEAERRGLVLEVK